MSSIAPCISVITPNYNHGHYLSELVAALADQTPQPLELLIIDDASTDNSIEIATKLSLQYPFVRLIQNSTNQGVVAAMNQGIQEAKGKYLAFRAADDLDLPGHFKAALDLLEANPNVDLFCGDLKFFTNTTSDGIVEPVGFSPTPASFPTEKYPNLFGTRWVNGHTVTIRKKAMIKNAPFIEEIAFIADWFHFMAAGFRGGFCYSPHAVVAARVSQQSYSSQKELDDTPARKAISAMLLAILGPYHDTKTAFIKSGALLRFGHPLEQVIRSNPEFEDFNSVANEISKIRLGEGSRESSLGLEGAIVQSLKEKTARLKDIAKDNALWIYGGGGHTRALLSCWKQLGLPKPKGILSSTAPETPQSYGLNNFELSLAPVSPGDAVILSSKSYEGYMANRIHKMGTLRCVAVWNHNLDKLD